MLGRQWVGHNGPSPSHVAASFPKRELDVSVSPEATENFAIVKAGISHGVKHIRWVGRGTASRGSKDLFFSGS